MLYFADLEQQIISVSIRAALTGALIVLVSALIAVSTERRLKKRQFKKLKFPLFAIIVATVVAVTSFLTYNTIYLNVVSESKGPVHWHADIEYWACGSEIEFRDPTGFLSNKIGTSTYHEHNDKRIHLEGVVVDKARDASLGKFLDVTGGYINDDAIGIPINEDRENWLVTGEQQDGDRQDTGFLSVMDRYVTESTSGDLVLNLNSGSVDCGDGTGELQVFVYQYDEGTKTYTQTKLDDPAAYVIRDDSLVPPGDCIIVDFDTPKELTDRICEQYGVRDSERCTEFGVKEYDPDLCNIRFVGHGGM